MATRSSNLEPSGIELVDRASLHADRIAVCDETSDPRSLTYGELLLAARRRARALLENVAASERLDSLADLEERRVAFLVTPSIDYVVTQWAIWLAGGIAVPLCVSHPKPELEYVLNDSDVSLVLASEDRAELAGTAAETDGRALRVLGPRSTDSDSSRLLDESDPEAKSNGRRPLPRLNPKRRAMIVYTSGTTGKPKGVVTTHGNLLAQIRALVEAWGWRADDSILNVLPLHHVHGIVNVLCCALWSGARLELVPSFEAPKVWDRFASGDLTLFMAVPTVYSKLLGEWRTADRARQEHWSKGAQQLRLMVSGSAALPVSILEDWEAITGHRLLERYGMSETGMILSNPLSGERVAGSVGGPLPEVEVRLRDGGEPSASAPRALEGELEVRGPAVFHEYWRRPEETVAAFDDDWFRTGDRVLLDEGRYRMLGRTSVDILKTGGYKVSALEIEEVLREHPRIGEVAVVGVEDEEWGQRVAAVIVPASSPLEGRDERPMTLNELRTWTKERLAAYKVPSLLLVVDELPRNALGKVTKPAVVGLFRSGVLAERPSQG